MKLDSYWIDTAPAFRSAAPEPPGSGRRVDVAIIGAGFTGLTAARALAAGGASVAVLEAGAVASGASGRNGGHCNNGTIQDFSGLVSRFGLERAKAIYREFDLAVDAVQALVEEERIDCNFNRCGKLKLAAKPAHYEGLVRTGETLLANVDSQVAFVPKAQLREEIDSPLFHGALLQKRSASLHPGRFGVGLAESAARHGARIHPLTAVTGLERLSGRRHRLTTAAGSFEAEQVLVASGCSRVGPLGWFRRRLVPVGSFIVVTEPIAPDKLRSLMPNGRNYVTTLNVGNYFRLTPDQRLLFGGRARFAMSSPTSDRRSGEILRRQLEAAFPSLRGIGIDYCWGGLVDMTQDRLPRAGEHEGLLYAMGYSGHGVQMSVRLGQAMADVLAGRAAASPWLGQPWKAIPGHFGDPWFLPLFGAYYRLKDIVQ